ncbi:MAG: outer membrane protein [Alphaproteobacteria bacterium]
MTPITRFAAALAAFGFAAAPAGAHDPQSNGGLVGDDFYATAFVSGQYGMFGADNDDIYYRGGKGFGGGISVGRGFENAFGSGLALRTELEGSIGLGELGAFDADYRYQTYFGNVWWDLDCAICEGRMTPYFGGGLGYGRINSDDAGIEGGGFSYQVGAGFNYRINEDVFLGLGYRYLGTNYEAGSAEDFEGHRLDGRVGIPF